MSSTYQSPDLDNLQSKILTLQQDLNVLDFIEELGNINMRTEIQLILDSVISTRSHWINESHNSELGPLFSTLEQTLTKMLVWFVCDAGWGAGKGKGEEVLSLARPRKVVSDG